MKLFKTTDEKFKDLGFKKIQDNDISVVYERWNSDYNYTHVISIVHRRNTDNIVQSYDKDLFDEKRIGNTCVGLTYYEMKLIMKKMKEKNWIK